MKYRIIQHGETIPRNAEYRVTSWEKDIRVCKWIKYYKTLKEYKSNCPEQNKLFIKNDLRIKEVK